jgi:transposase
MSTSLQTFLESVTKVARGAVNLVSFLLTLALFSHQRRNGKATNRRQIMGSNRADATEADIDIWSAKGFRPSGAHGYSVRAAFRHPMGHVAARNGLRFGDDVLAPAQGVAGRWGMGSAAPSVAGETAPGRSARSVPSDRRQLINPGGGRWKKTGPNPTDRRRPGSKHHLLTDAQGIPISVILTEANRHDITQLLPLVAAIPPIGGKPGAPWRKPALIQADRGYDFDSYRRPLHAKGIRTLIARRRTPHGSGLGKTRWVVERTIAWLHWFRRLRIRYERLASVHEAFLKLGCCLICWQFLKRA